MEYVPYAKILCAPSWGYYIYIIDTSMISNCGPTGRMLSKRYFAFSFEGAETKAKRLLAKYNKARVRDSKEWKVT
jgi:hypothetical protein